MRWRINNQTVLLTGVSSGIGYELAKIFAENKYNLILVATSKEKLDQITNRSLHPNRFFWESTL
ncbi:SDR family NAD(P)-dependent oxidoreductase [Halalkalibacter kiskunsagensis]|uniref:SDR family NAD(P)-dependent oxidoreductase n=1 Tax=Halalkalibacter kiskunsagensis TaxID=1548599 RepID=A0ABV6KC09_9BACI